MRRPSFLSCGVDRRGSVNLNLIGIAALVNEDHRESESKSSLSSYQSLGHCLVNSNVKITDSLMTHANPLVTMEFALYSGERQTK